MNSIEFQSRFIQKHDTEANWRKRANFVPLKSEFIIYDSDEEHNYPRIKIGDGSTIINNLPFATSYLEDKIVDEVSDVIRYTKQALTLNQQKQAKVNLGVADGTLISKAEYERLVEEGKVVNTVYYYVYEEMDI